jgi:hypothetical protein
MQRKRKLVLAGPVDLPGQPGDRDRELLARVAGEFGRNVAFPDS